MDYRDQRLVRTLRDDPPPAPDRCEICMSQIRIRLNI